MISEVPLPFDSTWDIIEKQGIRVLEDYLVYGKERYPAFLNPDGSKKVCILNVYFIFALLQVILFLNEEYSHLYT